VVLSGTLDQDLRVRSKERRTGSPRVRSPVRFAGEAARWLAPARFRWPPAMMELTTTRGRRRRAQELDRGRRVRPVMKANGDWRL
jgi:hypothetical protein